MEESFFQNSGISGPSNFAPSYDLHIAATPATVQGGDSSSGPNFWSRHGTQLREVLAEVYGIEPSHIDLPASIDGSKRYDFDLVLPQQESRETINRLAMRGIEKELHIRMVLEPRKMKVYVLTALESVAAHALPVNNSSFSTGWSSFSSFDSVGTARPFPSSEEEMEQARESRFCALASGVPVQVSPVTGLSMNGPIAEFAKVIENVLDRILVDETHLQGRYEFKTPDNLQISRPPADVLKDLGLVLTPAEREVTILSVRAVDASSTIPLTEVGSLGQTPAAGGGILPGPASQVRLEDVRVTGLDADGVMLTSPSSPDFDARVDLAAPGWGPIIKPVKPYVVLISNTTTHKVVAYALEWTLIGANGGSEAQGSQHRDADAIAGDFNTGLSRAVAILPGKERLAASDFEVSDIKPADRPMIGAAMDQWIQQILRNYGNVRKVEARLVTAIFDNGELIGEDKYSLASQLTQELDARQNAYRAIVERLDHGASVEEAYRSVRSASPGPPQNSSWMDLAVIQTMMALSDAEGLRKKYGDSRIGDVLRQAILKEPFVIRRKGN